MANSIKTSCGNTNSGKSSPENQSRERQPLESLNNGIDKLRNDQNKVFTFFKLT